MICITLLLLLSLSVFSQKISYSRMDSLAYDLAYTKYNVGRFKSQMMTGYMISTSGMLTLMIGNIFITQQSKDPNNKITNASIIVNSIGGGLVLIGGIVSLDSYSWLKRASIKPSQYGLTFSIDLEKKKEREEFVGTGY